MQRNKVFLALQTLTSTPSQRHQWTLLLRDTSGHCMDTPPQRHQWTLRGYPSSEAPVDTAWTLLRGRAAVWSPIHRLASTMLWPCSKPWILTLKGGSHFLMLLRCLPLSLLAPSLQFSTFSSLCVTAPIFGLLSVKKEAGRVWENKEITSRNDRPAEAVQVEETEQIHWSCCHSCWRDVQTPLSLNSNLGLQGVKDRAPIWPSQSTRSYIPKRAEIMVTQKL